jgi:hypothetical protein
MKRKYCCDASRRMYLDHYAAQSGSGLPVFYGYTGQRGHGLGSILAGFFRQALPIIKKGLGFFGKEAIRTGAKIASDVVERGQNVGDSTKKRVSERINEFVPGLIPQSGSGVRRGRKRKRTTKKVGVSKRRRKTSRKTSAKRKGRKRKTGAKTRRRSRIPAAFL